MYRPNLLFYALGETGNFQFPKPNPLGQSNFSYRDTANSILERNAYTMNASKFDNLKEKYNICSTLKDSNRATNNYMDPITSFEKRMVSDINKEFANKRTFENYRIKMYSKDLPKSNITSGVMLSKSDFKTEKNNMICRSQSMPALPPTNFNNDANKNPNIATADNIVNSNSNMNINTNFAFQNVKNDVKPNSTFNVCGKNTQLLSNKLLIVNKNQEGKEIRFPKNYWMNKNKEKKNEFNRESSDAPDTFHHLTKELIEKYNNDLIAKGDTITLISKNRSWITVTPKHKNRRHPLESIKVKNDEDSKVLPLWMMSGNHVKKPDFMKGVFYKSIRDGKCTKELVDKNNLAINGNKSIFSFGDFRHNVCFKEDTEKYQKDLMDKPKVFLQWDDGRQYDAKKKKDYK